MKSKQWIATLVPLVRDVDLDSEAYFKAVEDLYQETRAIIDLRLQGVKDDRHPAGFLRPQHGNSLGSGDRRLAAYREGLVKWDAVVHGVTLALGNPPPFPFFKGGPLVHELSQLQERIEQNKVSFDEAKSQFSALSHLIRAMNYHEQVIFTSLLELTQTTLNKGALRQVETVGESLKELVTLIQQGKGTSQRAMALHAQTYHQRRKLKGVIDSLPARDQLTAYLLLGQTMGGVASTP